jgi:hypothetical protein
VLSVLRRFTNYDYPFGIFKLFLAIVIAFRIGPTVKAKDQVTRTLLKTGVNSGAPEG